MAKYTREDILQAACRAFPDSRLTKNGFTAEPSEAELITAIVEKKSRFRKMYDYLTKPQKRPAQLRDHILGIKKTRLSELEELTLAMISQYEIQNLTIKIPELEIEIYDTANTVYSCTKDQNMLDAQIVSCEVLFLKFVAGAKTRYCIRKHYDGIIFDYYFEKAKNSKSGDFSTVVYTPKGVNMFERMYQNTSLANIVDLSNSSREQRNTLMMKARQAEQPLPPMFLHPVGMKYIRAGIVAKLMEDKIKEIEGHL